MEKGRLAPRPRRRGVHEAIAQSPIAQVLDKPRNIRLRVGWEFLLAGKNLGHLLGRGIGKFLQQRPHLLRA